VLIGIILRTQANMLYGKRTVGREDRHPVLRQCVEPRAAIDHLLAVRRQNNRVEQSDLLEVGGELDEFGRRQQREEFGRRVRRDQFTPGCG
jgi:hypothetical protein